VINQFRFAAANHMLKSCFAGFGLFFSRAHDVWSSREPVHARAFVEFIRRSRNPR
jgi:hypothetical protein